MRKLLILVSLLAVLAPISEARRGCCSWHGGVDSCDERTGRIVCRDGTYSPSCTCDMEQPTMEMSSKTPLALLPQDPDKNKSECLSTSDQDIEWLLPIERSHS